MHFIGHAGNRDLVEIVLQYALERGNLHDHQALLNMVNNEISHEVGEKIMTFAEQMKLEGKLEGKLETAKNMLNAGIDIVFIAKMTGLAKKELEALKKN